MRRIFSTVLVLMLVLRGLLGDAMAMGMMPVVMHHEQQQQTQTQTHTAMPEHAGHNMASMHGDMTMAHHGESMSATDHCTSESASMQQCGSSKHIGGTCSACDICNSTLHTAAELVLTTAAAPQSLQIDRSTRFASASPAQVVKPPIA